MKRILLGSVASVFVIGNALAQQATPTPGMDMKGKIRNDEDDGGDAQIYR